MSRPCGRRALGQWRRTRQLAGRPRIPGNRGPCRRLRSPDPAVQPSRKTDVVLEVTVGAPDYASSVSPALGRSGAPGRETGTWLVRPGRGLGRAGSAQAGARLLRAPPSPTTAHAASRSKAPTNTDSAANASRSLTSSRSWLQPMTARMVRCLGSRERTSPPSRSSGWPRPVASCSSDREAILAAASSSASGSPSSLRTMPCSLVVVERSHGVHRAGAGHEHRAGGSVVEPAQVDDLLARRPQRLARGRKDLEVGTARKESGGEFRHALDDVLAGVEDEQSASPRQIVAEEIDLVPGDSASWSARATVGATSASCRHLGELHEPHRSRD